MADTSLNENRLALLIWQTSNLWQSRVRRKLKESEITLNEYLILETIYLLQQENVNITQQDICKNASIDRSVVSLQVSKLEEKKLISKQQPQDKRSDSLILTTAGNDLINNIIDNIIKLENELFGFTLTFFSMIIGVSAGAIQGYFGGKTDLFFQRFMEVWSAIPTLYVLIILASVIQPNFWWLLIILLLFSWMGYVGVVRAEFLRARNFDYIRAAKALGVSNIRIMIRHMLPNATIATVTFLPFSLSASVTALSGLDFLGFGLPPGSASLGEMVNQGRNNLQAPWLGITSFLTLGLMLGLLVFVGEAIRDSLDPRKTFN